MYTPRTSVEAIPNASIHHSALQNRDFGHTYDRSRRPRLKKSATPYMSVNAGYSMINMGGLVH